MWPLAGLVSMQTDQALGSQQYKPRWSRCWSSKRTQKRRRTDGGVRRSLAAAGAARSRWASWACDSWERAKQRRSRAHAAAEQAAWKGRAAPAGCIPCAPPVGCSCRSIPWENRNDRIEHMDAHWGGQMQRYFKIMDFSLRKLYCSCDCGKLHKFSPHTFSPLIHVANHYTTGPDVGKKGKRMRFGRKNLLIRWYASLHMTFIRKIALRKYLLMTTASHFYRPSLS